MTILKNGQNRFIKDILIGSFRNIVSFFFEKLNRSFLIKKIREYGRLIALFYDFVSIIAAWSIAYWILMGITTNPFSWWYGAFNLLLILPLQFFIFRKSGLYRGFWRFASIQDFKKILQGALLGGIIFWMVLYLNNIEPMLAKSLGSVLYSIFLIGLLSFPRFLVRYIKDYKHQFVDYQRVIIIGAGNAGEGLVRDLLRDNSHRYKPVAFVDDDLSKLGREIHNVRVIGTVAELPKLIQKHDVDLVLIAIPSASSASMRSVVEVCEKAKVRCSTLPGLKDITNGRVSINILRNISLEDLIGRYPVTCQLDFIKKFLKNKNILVTGGGGSIGSELCRQIMALGTFANLIILDSNEYNLYSIEMELRQKFPDAALMPILMNITDHSGMAAVFKKFNPEIVFHVAAYKHVPMLENQPRIAIFNNVIGTGIVATEAIKANVDLFILISSDKAVNPTNVMGATKRAAEYICQNLNVETSKTKFITVRFGNVLDSAGSVIPLFRKQIEMGGPVTVTHPDITRYFMTIPEASQLILQAAFLGKGGEIFVLDMGDPIKIRYLAEQMIKLAGKSVDKDIKIIYSGLRPGEKLYEECFYSNEILQQTQHVKILQAKSLHRDFQEIENICQKMNALYHSSHFNHGAFIELLRQLVPEYKENIASIGSQKIVENA